MVKKFSREISGTQSQYKATIERKYITQQCSYNLPLELEEHLKTLGAIEKNNPTASDTNAKYKLTNGYKMCLGNNIIAAIGDSYKTTPNEVVFTHTEGENGSSKKLQLKKTDFKALGSDNYKWFVDLYEKNIEGTVLTITVDDVQKTICFDLELTPFFFSGQAMFEESENIFDGFRDWLTTYNNPDYTGKEKYSTYPNGLKRIIQFMFENNLIEDINLNELNFSFHSQKK